MELKINLYRNSKSQQIILPCILFLFCIAILCFCCFYQFSGYDDLVRWYIGLNDCFYKHETWNESFFTPAIKSAGNWYCLIAMLISVAGAYIAARRMKEKRQPRFDSFNIGWHEAMPISICLVLATVAWVWGKSLVAASNDEVFSAVNCAGIHPFQTVSYYMLPNNHVLFNFINNIIFHPFSNKVFTGRLISLGCYWALIVIFYYLLLQVVSNKWLVVLATTTMALQFPIWGFSFQARGYELIALAEWLAFISFFKYLFSNHKKWLVVFLMTSCAGYFCVPSFLYFHVAVIIFALFYQVINKKIDSAFWKYQLAGVALVYLLYLPCLCFSGPLAITHNQYVVKDQEYKQLLELAIPMIQNYVDYCFLAFTDEKHNVAYFLFLLPLSLFFFRKNKIALFMGCFFVAMWTSCFLLTVKMKIFPIDRALTGQLSITLGLLIYALYLLTYSISQRIKQNYLPLIVLPVFLLLLSVNFVIEGKAHVPFYTCHSPVNLLHDEKVKDGLSAIPHGSTVAFSNESFYWYYLCQKYGYRASKCVNGSEEYYITLPTEPLPVDMQRLFGPIKLVGGYIIYKRQ